MRYITIEHTLLQIILHIHILLIEDTYEFYKNSIRNQENAEQILAFKVALFKKLYIKKKVVYWFQLNTKLFGMAFGIRKSLEKSQNFKWVNCKYQGNIMVSRKFWIKITEYFLPRDYFDELIYNIIPCKYIYFMNRQRERAAQREGSALPESIFSVIVSFSYRAM